MASVSRALRPAVARRILAVQLRSLSTTVSRWNSQSGELGVGELQGAKFKIEPLRRTGEDDATKRARLVCTFSSWRSIELPSISLRPMLITNT